MASLFERKQKLGLQSSQGVARPGVSQDRTQELIAAGRRTQNTLLESRRNTPTAMPRGSDKAPFTAAPAPFDSYGSRNAPAIVDRASANTRESLRKNLGVFGRFLVGSSEGEFNGTNKRLPSEDEGIIEGIQNDLYSRGVIKLLWGNLTKRQGEKVADATALLAGQGYDRTEAQRLATQYYNEGKKSVPENVRLTLTSSDATTKAWGVVEMLDVIPVFRAATKTLGRSFVRETIQKSLTAENAVESRRILAEAFPKMQGTQELNDLVDFTRRMSNDVEAEQIVGSIMSRDSLSVARGTEAQRVLYENGVPVVRGGRTPATTVSRGGQAVPNQTADALALRTEIRSVLAGEAEAARLSNLDVFADEVKAGAFPFKATPDAPVKLFVSDAVSDVTRLRPGERLATTKEVIEQVTENGKAKMLEVMPDDVVRLADGSFVYAPKNALGKGISGTLRTLREGQRAKVQAIETSRELTKAQRAVTTERNIKEAAEQKKIAAAQAAERKAAKEKEIAYAKEVVERGEEYAKKMIDEVETKRTNLIKETVAKRAAAIKALADQKKVMNTLVRNLKAIRVKKEKIPKQYTKKMDDIRSGKTKPKKEEIPNELAERELAIEFEKETLALDPVAPLSRFAATRGEFKGRLTENAINVKSGLGLDVYAAGAGFDTLDDARQAFDVYQGRKEALRLKEIELKNDIDEWKSGAKKRAIDALQKERTQVLKELIKSERGLAKQIDTNREAIETLKKNSPEVRQSIANIKADISRAPQAIKKGITENLRNEMKAAKAVLKGEEAAKAKAQVTKAKEVNKEKSVDLANSLQEMYSNASAMFREADAAVPAPVKKVALTGTAKVIDNLATKAKEFDDALSFKKDWAEENMPKDFGGAKLRDNIGVDSVPMSKLKMDPRYMKNGKWTEQGEEFFNLRPNHYEKMTVEEILEKPLLLDDGFGKNVVRDGNHRLVALKNKGYEGNVPVIKTDGSGTKLEEIWQQANETVTTSITNPLNPVKGDGKTVANQIIKGLEDELEVIKQSFKERGLSLADLPDTHKAIGNPTLLKQAFADMVEDPYKVYSDFVSGKFPDGTTRAAYGMALMKSDFVLNNPARMDLVARAFIKGNSRLGQELQSIKVFGKMDYLNIVGRFSQQADELLKARGVNVEAEATKLMKLFGDEIDSVKAISKKDVTDALTSITCKVE